MSLQDKTVNDQQSLASHELTAPFGLKDYLTPPKMKLDLVPILDLITLALLFSLLFTRYLLLPGVQIELPKTDLSIQQNGSSVAVLTIANGDMLFFAGSVHEQNSIGKALQQYFDKNWSDSPVLLVKANASMDIQQFLELCKMAQDAGFEEIQIAADPKKVFQESTAETLTLPVQNNDLVLPVQ